MPRVFENLRRVTRRLGEACLRAGRRKEDLTLVAVSKYATAGQVAELLAAADSVPFPVHIGESRVQDAVARKAEVLARVGPEPLGRTTWRMVGHLQRNKVSKALEVFDAVDSLDRSELAAALDRVSRERGRKTPVLVQVNIAGRPGQHGTPPEEVGRFLDEVRRLDGLKVSGLMAIAPDLEPVEGVRPYFARLRRIFEEHFGPGEGAALSMGMSRDFEIAVEEGAHMVRVGSLLFDG